MDEPVEISPDSTEQVPSFHQLKKLVEQLRAAWQEAGVIIPSFASSGDIQDSLDQLDSYSQNAHAIFFQELDRRSRRYRSIIEQLRRAVESVSSEKYLLEFKKRDLLNLTSDLEDAYEKISRHNAELEAQKQLISEQAEELRVAQERMLDVNRELETQKEALLDQSDYLHEANSAIIQMHEEVQQQKEEILRKNVELEDLNAEKNSLIGIVAHDLKSPLSQVKGLVSLVKMMSEQKLDPETAKMINMIEASVGNMSAMILKILDIEAVESKGINLTLEDVNLTDLLSTVVDRFDDEASKKSITLRRVIATGKMARVDSSYADQVFQNLISNAVKFSPQNKSITISLTEENDFVVCEVKDEGPGLTEDDKKKLFGKYQKLSARPTGAESSTGLGLSIVKKFVNAMQGEIWCESEFGKGASFFVKYPVAKS